MTKRTITCTDPMARLLQLLDQQDHQLAQMDAQIDQLTGEAARLTEEKARLEQEISARDSRS